MSTTNANLDAALALARAGITVFPVKLIKKSDANWDKLPLIKDWPNNASSDQQQIERWWRAWPGALPGIPCGHNDIILIDADRHGGPDGVEAFAQLCSDLGLELPAHPITQTASNGFHHFFKMPAKRIGNCEGDLPPSINVRGDRGFAVAPGAGRPDGA